MLNKRILFVALFLFLVVVSVRNAAAQTFSITFNATTLTAQDFSILPVGSGSSGSGSTSIITTLSLLPGTYTFRAPGNSEIFFLFTVTNSGTVDYDSALDGFVSGRGNSTLAVSGFPITFDARTLTSADFSIISESFFSGLASAVTTLRLLPGLYTFKAPGNSEIFFFFTVTNSGTVDFDSALDGFVGGRGSSTLAVSGFPITFDARTLTSADFSIIHSTFFSGLTSAVTTLRLLPGQYTFKAPGNSEIFFFFTVTNSGTVNYDSALDSFVSGRGSSTLAVSGYPITFDARTLTSADFSISRFFSGPTSTVATLRLLPETYTFIAPANQENFFFFTVTNSGTVQYASTLNTCVSGRDTNGLTVFCIPGVNAPPVAQCQNVTVPTGSSTCSADASINNGSFDPDGTIVTSSQSPAGPYPLGTTPVTMTVTDNQGASAVCTANVTVADTTPPVIICPPDKEAIAPLGATGVPLTYTAPTRTDNCAYFTIPCDPASGSTFVVGTTTVVTCGVRDAANSRATCSFNVTVQTPQTAIQEIQEIVNDMRGLEPGVLIDHLDEAVMLLGDLRAAAENLLRWDGTPPQPPAPVNTYGGPPEIHSPGWDYSPNTMVRVVCSTLITELLQHAYMFSIGTSPKAKDYHDVIKAENRFTLIDNVNDILPGDIIAIKYPDGSDDDSGDSERITGVTGHVMLVAEWPTFYSTTACPESPEPGTEQYTVKVIDSSSSYHGDFDTRRSNPGGLGLGVFRLYVRGSGEIVGYTWSTICKVKDPVTGDLEPVEVYGQDPNDPMTRHLVVGRLVPGSQIGSDATAMSQAKVSEGGLTKAEANWLINILKAAIQQLDRGNRTPAINQLNAFINQVEALERSGRLSSDQADALITSVQAVIDAL